MRNTISRIVLPAALLFVIGCATTGGGMNTYKEQIGVATPGDLAKETRLVFERFHFVMEREDSSLTYQVFQTRWNGRYPFQDELDSGVVEAMTQLTVTGRARGGGSGSGTTSVRVVEFSAENMVRYAEQGEWVMGLATPMFRDYAEEISNELKMRLTQGLLCSLSLGRHSCRVAERGIRPHSRRVPRSP